MGHAVFTSHFCQGLTSLGHPSVGLHPLQSITGHAPSIARGRFHGVFLTHQPDTREKKRMLGLPHRACAHKECDTSFCAVLDRGVLAVFVLETSVGHRPFRALPYEKRKRPLGVYLPSCRYLPRIDRPTSGFFAVRRVYRLPVGLEQGSDRLSWALPLQGVFPIARSFCKRTSALGLTQ